MPLAKDIARKINRTPGQVLLRWAVQKGIHVNPKSNQAGSACCYVLLILFKLSFFVGIEPFAQSNAYEVSRLKENLEVLDFALDDEDA